MVVALISKLLQGWTSADEPKSDIPWDLPMVLSGWAGHFFQHLSGQLIPTAFGGMEL